MQQMRRQYCSILQFTVTVAYILSSSTALASTLSSTSSALRTTAPRDFEVLDAERQLIVDVYYGGTKLTEATVTVHGGSVRFDEPGHLTALVPDLLSTDLFKSQLVRFLPANAALVCGAFNETEECGTLHPASIGIIFDEDKFRVDLFIGSALLMPAKRPDAVYLTPPAENLTLISRYGATISGNDRGDRSLHVQNRTIISLGALRLRGDSSVDTDSGGALETLALEHDRNDWRYTAGLLWAPGGDLIGRRKILGAGVSTQLDTRVDRRSILGSPLALYLQQSARVDILIDDRLIASRIYAAGNVVIDTSDLPDGSYPLVLRIQESGRPVREERQFYSKGSEVAPLGRPLYSAFVGLLAEDQGRAEKRLPFYEGSVAYRLSPSVGIDARFFGTSDKAIWEAGVIAFTPVAKVRGAALFSGEGDYGASVRASSSGRGPVSFSIDLRKVVSHDGGPLLPTTKRRGTFNEDVESQIGDQGSFTQGTGIIAARLSNALIRLTGLYRQSASSEADYSIGGSLELPVLNTQKWNVVLQTDARATNREVLAFIGVRAFFNRGRTSLAATAGYNYISKGEGRVTGEVQGAVQSELSSGSEFVADAAVGRDFDASYLRTDVRLQGNVANVRSELLHRFGEESSTQYSASVDGGIAFGSGALAFSGRDVADSAVTVSATGAETSQTYEVLVNDGVRTTVGGRKSALVFLQPYENYKIRLRPVGEGLSSFDVSDRDITMHPGRLMDLSWRIASTFVIFGRAVTPNGIPLTNADVSGDHGIGRTDGQGYFQIEARKGDSIRLIAANRSECLIAAVPGKPAHSFLAAGDLTCQ